MVTSTHDEDNPAVEIPASLTIIDRARVRVKKSFERTKLGIKKEALLPRFDYSELTIGVFLGKGGFGTVNEITNITVRKDANISHASFSFRSWAVNTGAAGAANGAPGGGRGATHAEDEEEEEYVPEFDPDFDESAFQSKKFIADYCTGKGGAGRYAMKVISQEVKEDEKKFIRAAMDMATETKFLSVLDHPNIINLRGVGQGDMFERDYFLVLDRLYATLKDKLTQWKVDVNRPRSFMERCKGVKKKKKALFLERLVVAKALASAMEYLHGLK